MTLVDDVLFGRLTGHRLIPRRALPTAPDGERRGSQPGTGMEFADHRDYHAGDDLRHLDTNAYARLGRPYIKLFASDRGLDVAILVDTSPSMAYGDPTKQRVAAELAAALAFVGISGGDRVRLGTFGRGRLAWRPVVTSSRNLSALVKGIDREGRSGGAETDLLAVAAGASAHLPPNGMTIVLSDWWTADASRAARAFTRGGRELVAIQVLSPEEEDPQLLGDGWTRLEDAEQGETLELSLEGESHTAYLRALGNWREQLREAVEGDRGRLLTVRTDRPVPELLLDDWRRVGLLG